MSDEVSSELLSSQELLDARELTQRSAAKAEIDAADLARLRADEAASEEAVITLIKPRFAARAAMRLLGPAALKPVSSS
jgi:hypothetical protein